MLHLFKRKIIHPLQRFIHDSRAVGITLLVCTAVSLILANLGFWDNGYINMWSAGFTGINEHKITIGLLHFPNTPLYIINDGLMAVFFFLAGMEIKRELVNGELASVKKSLLPVFAAVGGMLVPALFFGLFNKGQNNMQGWAIPIATDIAFTLGVASLLGNRIPVSLKIFITALAIIDDLGAIIVIAFFYGGHLEWIYLCGAVITIIILWLFNRSKKAFGFLHVLLGLILWYCMFNSGIHATISGVIFAMLVPTPLLKKFELALHKPVYFIIMPLFALANTAIAIPDNSFHAISSTLSIGIIIGLLIGKPLGICGACYFLIKKKLAEFPRGVNWHKMIGAGILAGIGFTISLFISSLAFFTDQSSQDTAKIAVLIASLLAILLGYAWFRSEKKSTPHS